MHPRAAWLVRTLELSPHPEGGHYREVFRSDSRVRRETPPAERTAATSIYFLLAAGEHSRWHRVASDEIWHFYEGDPLELLWLDERAGRLHRELLGPVAEEARPVRVVPAGCWQAARPLGGFTLVGCSVAPGFDFADFALLSDRPGEAEAARRSFPELV